MIGTAMTLIGTQDVYGVLASQGKPDDGGGFRQVIGVTPAVNVQHAEGSVPFVKTNQANNV